MTTRSRAALLCALVAAAFVAPHAAQASVGSVPPEVAAYATDPKGLLARLDELFGLDATGGGIAFDETAKAGQLNRAFAFTDAYLNGETTETPIQLVNEWTAPITIADEPVGLALIWINQTTIDPELADFTADPTLATALAEVPADVTLVHDADRSAWFTLVETELTPLVPGSSGVTAPISLEDYQQRLLDASAQAPTQEPASSVTTLSIVVIVASLLVIAAVLLVPVVRQRRRAATAPVEDALQPGQKPE